MNRLPVQFSSRNRGFQFISIRFIRFGFSRFRFNSAGSLIMLIVDRKNPATPPEGVRDKRVRKIRGRAAYPGRAGPGGCTRGARSGPPGCLSASLVSSTSYTYLLLMYYYDYYYDYDYYYYYH